MSGSESAGNRGSDGRGQVQQACGVCLKELSGETRSSLTLSASPAVCAPAILNTFKKEELRTRAAALLREAGDKS